MTHLSHKDPLDGLGINQFGQWAVTLLFVQCRYTAIGRLRDGIRGIYS